jgi:hypothetical protein
VVRVDSLTQTALHEFDLLLLFDDDRLGKAAQNGIATVNQLELRHIDRALMMGNHHQDEIAIRITSRLGSHYLGVHAFHGLHHLRRKRIVLPCGRINVIVVLRKYNGDTGCDKEKAKPNRSLHFRAPAATRGFPGRFQPQQVVPTERWRRGRHFETFTLADVIPSLNDTTPRQSGLGCWKGAEDTKNWSSVRHHWPRLMDCDNLGCDNRLGHRLGGGH